MADAQWSWLEEKLSKSAVDFLFVAGHYPIYSAGSDGTTSLLVEELLPLLAASGAHYLSGHDRMWEHIVVSPSGVNMFLAGAGKECCYDPKNVETVPDGYIKFMVSGDGGGGDSIGYDGAKKSEIGGGFQSLVFYDDEVTVTFHDQDGDDLYVAPMLPTRKLS